MAYRRARAFFVLLLLFLSFTEARQVQAQSKKPNILVIMGDDIGWYNTSIYNPLLERDCGEWRDGKPVRLVQRPVGLVVADHTARANRCAGSWWK